MKTRVAGFVSSRWLSVIGFCFTLNSLLALPVINSIRIDGTNVVVTAQVPAGIQRVTLECRNRLESGGWEPRAVARLDGGGGQVTFTVPKSATLEVLRVRADDREPLPASFYSGTNRFEAGQVSAGGLAAMAGGATDGPGAGPTPGTGDNSRAVVESDIWKLDGDTLYFFNQYRGLQIIDVSVPDAASVKGALPLPAAGEQMYLLDPQHVVLLARDACGGWGSDSESRLLIVDVSGNAPSVAASLPVKGAIRESRLVGGALYVASDTLRPAISTTWEWGTAISSFDLRNPAAPVAKDTLWYSGSGNVIAATDVFLFAAAVSPLNSWQSVVHCIDITSPDGAMRETAAITTAGRVNDKFKLDWKDSVFTAVSEAPGTGSPAWVTRLETFHLPDPRSAGPEGVVKLGQLELGSGERVFATRFDSNRVYVVTFRRIDPLWVVDLSNPSKPVIAGEVQVPGYSTFIQPLGDRLVTVGIDDTNNWRVGVSLFDVHDPTAPALLSKVALGQNYSWSEANTDEKAFNVMPDEHLILLPFQGYVTNGYASRVQLVDLNRDSLALRGTIDHPGQPRRATVHNQRILSLSGQELLSVDATDRDLPQIKWTLPLGWSADQLILQGPYLLEITSGSDWLWNNLPAPAIRITPAAQPDRVLNEIAPPRALPILGAAVRDGRLYLAQSQRSYYPVPLAGGGDPNGATNPPPLYLSIYDLSNLPDAKLLGETNVTLSPLGWGAAFQLVWPKTGVLVLAGGGGGYWNPWLAFGGIATDGPVGGAVLWPYFWGNYGGRLIAFDVSDATAPKLLSDVNLTTNAWWNFSPTRTVNGLVYLSHQAIEPVVTGGSGTNSPATNYWVQRWYLDVVDYADAASPTVRKPVNIPGSLQGVGHGGELLYTVGPHWTNTTNGGYDGADYLDASAYDGVAAHLVDSLKLSLYWPHPALVSGDLVFVGHPAETNTVKNLLETWALSSAGKFTLLGQSVLPGPAQNLANFGSLLAAQHGNQVSLFNSATDSGVPAFLVTGGPSGCFWFDLNKADGALDRGLWLPLGAYGVGIVTVPPSPSP